MVKQKTLENLRHEATRLFADLQRNFPKTREILFTGCKQGEGVTSMAIALSRAVVRQKSARVLLVDANFNQRNAGLTKWAHGIEERGLRDLLPKQGQDPAKADAVLFKSGIKVSDGVEVFPRGVASAVEMADLENTGVLNEFRKQALDAYDFVFWDTASINFSPDAKILLSEVNDVILLVESDVTRLDHFTSSIAEINQVRANLLAVLRNRAGHKAFSVGADQQ